MRLKIHTINGHQCIKVLSHEGGEICTQYFEVEPDLKEIEVEFVQKCTGSWYPQDGSYVVVRVLTPFKFQWVDSYGEEYYNSDHLYRGWHSKFDKPLPVFLPFAEHEFQCGEFPWEELHGNLLNVECGEVVE